MAAAFLGAFLPLLPTTPFLLLASACFVRSQLCSRGELPTTPFLLLASACFVRSSPRLHNWLRTNRLFGKYLRDYEDGRGIPLRGKVAILLLMWASLAWSMLRIGRPVLAGLLALIGVGVTVYLVFFVPTMRGRR